MGGKTLAATLTLMWEFVMVTLMVLRVLHCNDWFTIKITPNAGSEKGWFGPSNHCQLQIRLPIPRQWGT